MSEEKKDLENSSDGKTLKLACKALSDAMVKCQELGVVLFFQYQFDKPSIRCYKKSNPGGKGVFMDVPLEGAPILKKEETDKK